jgi:hypothetical protein
MPTTCARCTTAAISSNRVARIDRQLDEQKHERSYHATHNGRETKCILAMFGIPSDRYRAVYAIDTSTQCHTLNDPLFAYQDRDGQTVAIQTADGVVVCEPTELDSSYTSMGETAIPDEVETMIQQSGSTMSREWVFASMRHIGLSRYVRWGKFVAIYNDNHFS